LDRKVDPKAHRGVTAVPYKRSGQTVLHRHSQQAEPAGGCDRPGCGRAVGERGLGDRTGDPAVGACELDDVQAGE
jgi:hypothetical protein